MLKQAYDSHCNLVLGEVEETIYVVDEDDEQETVRVRQAHLPLLRTCELIEVIDGQEAVRDALRQR